MKTRRSPTTLTLGLFVLILALLGLQTATWGQALPAAVTASLVGTAFTYQGQLYSGGTPVDDNCDFEFSLWDAVAGGNPVGSSQPALNIPVIGGLFAVELDFGSGAFTGGARWLQTAVRCPAGGGIYTTLAPRQALNPVPYAMQSQDLQLPFRKIIDSPDIAFSVVNSGDGHAVTGYTDGSGVGIDGGSGGSGTGVSARSDGSGIALGAWAAGSGRALHVDNYGTNDAASININNPDNTANLINAATDGLGAGASIRLDNPLNDMPAVDGATVGGGAAISGRAYGTGAAVQGWSWGSGWAGYFQNEGSGDGVRISSAAGTTGLSVVGGSKNAVVPTSAGARLLYTEESSEVWFTDYGFARLAGGSVFIAIDTLFAETVNLEEPYHVFVQAYGDAELYVSQRTPAGFEVRLRAGDPEVEFSYRLVATRRGYEGQRLESAAWADGDPNLNPARPAASDNGGAQ